MVALICGRDSHDFLLGDSARLALKPTGGHVGKMNMNIFVYAIPVLAVVAICFVIWGETFIGILSAVKKLRRARNECTRWRIEQVTPGRRVEDFCAMRLEEVGTALTAVASDPLNLRNFRFGDVAVIVHDKERHLRHSAKEIRFYSSAFIILLLGSALLIAPQVTTLPALFDKLAASHLVPLLELTMIVVWLIRLRSDIASIDLLFTNKLLSPL